MSQFKSKKSFIQIHDTTKNSLENLVKLLDPKLSLKQGQTDLIAMQHIFTIELNGKKILRKSSMIQIGDKKGFSAMSLTVGTPTAIGAQLILDNKISEKGVITPVYPDIYNT